MPDPSAGRVAVYLDFDNIVISWYDRVHGRNSYGRDRQRIIEEPNDPEIADRLAHAMIDVGAVIDYAASFGTLVLTRAYADWSSPVNAVYRTQLVARAVDLVQLFPAAAYAKNGADIRLAVDAVEDMFRLPDLTHVVIVGGDSDYVPLAQRCKRLGRYVIGVGVAGSTAKSLAAACDEFEAYDSLPGVKPIVRAPAKEQPAKEPAKAKDAASDATTVPAAAPARGRRGSGTKAAAAKAAEAAETTEAKAADAKDAAPDAAPKTRATGGRRAGSKTPAKDAATEAPPAKAPASAEVEASLVDALDEVAPPKRTNRRVTTKTIAPSTDLVFEDGSGDLFDDGGAEEPVEDPQETATALLERALRLGHDKDDAEWLHSSAVKTHMRRMDPSFSEKGLGYRSFSDFVKARESIAELEETGHERLVRLREH
nr:NYN domain-containing protein [Microbacterium sp. Root61]